MIEFDDENKIINEESNNNCMVKVLKTLINT